MQGQAGGGCEEGDVKGRGRKAIAKDSNVDGHCDWFEF